jgi:hypothetical protein
MRGILLSLVCAAGIVAAAPVKSVAAFAAAPAAIAKAAPAPLFALQQPDKTIDININSSGGHWYRSPVWIAIGAIALVVIVLLIVVAARGGGTTIVKE